MNDFFSRYYSESYRIFYQVLMLAGIITGIARYRKLSRVTRLLLLLLIITPVAELLAFYCALKFRNNSFIYNPFTVIQFAILGLIFFTETKKWIYIVLMVTGIAAGIINGIFFQPFFSELNTNTLLLTSLLIIVWYFLYLSYYFRYTDTMQLRELPLFWAGAGWMLFSIVSVISFGFMRVYDLGGVWDSLSVYTRTVSNYLLYASFIASFICPQKSIYNAIAGKE